MKNKKSIWLILLLLILLIGITPVLASEVKIGLIYTKDKGADLSRGKDPLKNYRDAIEANGGQVVDIVQGMDPQKIADIVDTIQGLIIPGGDDVDPRLYDEDRDEHLEKTDCDYDKLEMWLLDRCMEKNLPVLGICRGMQLINVDFGGTLYQDIPSQYKSETLVIHRTMKDGKSGEVMHQITISPNTLLHKLLKKDKVEVNSYHHQAVKELGKDLMAGALSEDALVEAIEIRNGGLILGVQFHPERLRKKDPTFDAIFKWLIGEARKKATAKK